MKRNVIIVGLAVWIIGGVLGGTIPSIRQISWAVSGVGVLVACPLLALDLARARRDAAAVGFLLLVLGEAIMFTFKAGDQNALLGAATVFTPALLLIGIPNVHSIWVRAAAVISGVLFGVIAVLGHIGQPVPVDTPLNTAAWIVANIAAIGWLVAARQSEQAEERVVSPAGARG